MKMPNNSRGNYFIVGQFKTKFKKSINLKKSNDFKRFFLIKELYDIQYTVYEKDLKNEEYYINQSLSKDFIDLEKIKVKFINLNGEETFYELNIYNCKILNEVIYYTKSNKNQSHGTLEGLLFGYLEKPISIETKNPVNNNLQNHENKEKDKDKNKDNEKKDNENNNKNGEKIKDNIDINKTNVNNEIKNKNEEFFEEIKNNLKQKLNTPFSHLFFGIPFLLLLFGFLTTFKIFLPLLLLFYSLLFLISLFRFRFISLFINPLLFLFLLFLIFFYNVFKSYNRNEKIKNDIKFDNKNNSMAYFKNDSILVYHKWNDYAKNTHECIFSLSKADYLKSKWFRENFYLEYLDQKNYNIIFNNLIEYNKDKLRNIYNSLDSIRIKNKYGRIEFCKILASMVQEIPYSLLLPIDCNSKVFSNDHFIENYLKHGGTCISNVRYGLFTPIEFIVNLNGDCDTRTMFLYILLKKYNYDVKVFVSEYYKHSVLGINLPFSGHSKEIKGKKYYFWELTSKGYLPGMIDPEFTNNKYWKPLILN